MEIKDLLNDMKEVISSLDYEIEYPENDDELNKDGLISFTKQLTTFIKKYACQGDKTLVKRNKKIIDFLKVKEQIVLNYCMYMNYYLLGQAKLLTEDGKAINLQENQVLKKLTYYRTLINQIEPIDTQIKAQLQQVNIATIDGWKRRKIELEAEGEEYEINLNQKFEEEAEGEFDNESEGNEFVQPAGEKEIEGEDNEAEDLEIEDEPWNKNLNQEIKEK